MDEQQVGEIAEAAFRARFGDVEVVRVNVRSGFDHEDDPAVDVNIIYDGKYEQLKGDGPFDVRREIIDKVWREAEDSPGYSMVHFIAKSEAARSGHGVRRAGTARSMQDRELTAGRGREAASVNEAVRTLATVLRRSRAAGS